MIIELENYRQEKCKQVSIEKLKRAKQIKFYKDEKNAIPNSLFKFC